MKINIVDVGARYGIHPNFLDLKDIANFFLFEIDKEECQRLKKKYNKNKNIKIFNQGIFSKKTILDFYIRNHNALNSLYNINKFFFKENHYKKKEFEKKKIINIKVDSLDSFFKKKIHILKLDVEGAELEVLKGAKNQLEKNCIGIRSEVTFSPVYKNAPLFSEINDFLLKKNFELINFDYTGKGSKYGKYAYNSKYGKLITTDAIWLKKNFDFKKKNIDKLFQISTFLFLNNSSDLAIDYMLKYVDINKESFKKYLSIPTVKFLKRKILILFKNLLSVPNFKEKIIYNDYKKLFGEEFPKLHKFYQKNI